MPWIRVSAVVTALALASGGARAQTLYEQTVVFVCEHGAAKSVVAAAHFNKLAREKGLALRAISRGTEPDPTVPARVRDGLRADGAALDTSFTPTRVAGDDVASAVRVITFDVKLPAGIAAPSRVTNWTGVSAVSDGYDPARNDIVSRVEVLVEELGRTTQRSAEAPREVRIFAVSGMV